LTDKRWKIFSSQKRENWRRKFGLNPDGERF